MPESQPRAMYPRRDAALALAGLGLPVFPLWWTVGAACACRKGADCGRNAGKHPRLTSWQTTATTDPDAIMATWTDYAAANIGVVTGVGAGILVLDVDAAAGGIDALTQLEAAHGALVDTPMVLTGSVDEHGRRGMHFYFQRPDTSLRLANSASKLGPGLDVRGDGGLVVGPGSLHHTGRQYEWDAGHHPDDMPFAPCPAWMINLILLRQSATATTPTGDWIEPAGLPPIADRVARARHWLVGWVARKGQAAQGAAGSSNAMGAIGNVIRGFAIERPEDYLPILDPWNDANLPPFGAGPGPDNYLRKIDQARLSPVIAIGHMLLPRLDPGLSDPEPVDEAPRVPTLLITSAVSEIHRHMDRVETALIAADLGLFASGTSLVTVVNTAAGPELSPVSKPTLRCLVNRVVAFGKPTPRGDFKPCYPPDELLDAMLDQGSWSVPAITAITECPTLRADGSLLTEAGLDSSSGILYLPDPAVEWLPVPDEPTYDDATAAYADLCEIIHDFPFAGPHHHTAALAAIMTAVLLPGIPGPTPLFLFDASSKASGKTLLARSVAIIASGRDPAPLTYPAEDEEMRKLLTAHCREGSRLVFFDNVHHPLGGQSLDSALTSTWWQDRILCTSATFKGPLKPLWLATGNNTRIEGDTHRRIIVSRIMPMDEHPDERSGFLHPNLPTWCRDNRARLVRAVLLLARAHWLLGVPGAETPMGSFEAWDARVRHVLLWICATDPLAGARGMTTDDDGTVRHILTAWHELWGTEPMSLRQVRRALDGQFGAGLKDALIEAGPTRDGSDWDARAIGKILAQNRDRVFGGRRFAVGASGRAGAQWKVVPTGL